MAKQKTEAQTDRYNRYGSPLQWVGATVVGSVSAASTFINLVRTKFHEDNSFRQGFAVLHEVKNYKLREFNDEQIQASLSILKKYVGDHPAYQELVAAREGLHLHGPKALEDFRDATKGKVQTKFDLASAVNRYTKASEDFTKECKEAIDKAMRSPEYKKLAINSSRRHSATKMGFDRLYDSYAETMYGIKSKGILGHTQGVWERFVGFGGYTKRNMLFKTAVAFGVAFGGTMMVFNQLNTRDKLNEIDKQSERADRKIDALLEKSGIRDEDISTRAEHRIKVKQREKIEDAIMRKSGSHVAKIMEDRAEAAEASHSAAI